MRNADNLGFVSSWRMLTRDKGWLKPVCLLTLVGVVPVLGQIALLGYTYEWARLTAWGVDAAPKQQGVRYGKVLATGALVLCLTVLQAIIIGVATSFLPVVGISAGSLVAGLSPLNVVPGLIAGTLFAMAATVVVGALSDTFISACALRLTLYDKFSAGWRVDRIVQMISRDLGGFLHVFFVSVIANLIQAVFATVAVTVGLVLLLPAAFVFDAVSYGMTVPELASTAVLPVVAIIAAAVVCVFVYLALYVVGRLITVNAMGQWFNRFQVRRWGKSADPLPTDNA